MCNLQDPAREGGMVRASSYPFQCGHRGSPSELELARGRGTEGLDDVRVENRQIEGFPLQDFELMLPVDRGRRVHIPERALGVEQEYVPGSSSFGQPQNGGKVRSQLGCRRPIMYGVRGDVPFRACARRRLVVAL